MNWWIAKGPPENWRVSFQKGNIWGVSERYKKSWLEIQPGDGLLFYATSPVKGLIGYGNVRSRFSENVIFWPMEERERVTFWPLRIRFEVCLLIPEEHWQSKAVVVSPRQSARQRALQKMSGDIAEDLRKSLLCML